MNASHHILPLRHTRYFWIAGHAPIKWKEKKFLPKVTDTYDWLTSPLESMANLLCRLLTSDKRMAFVIHHMGAGVIGTESDISEAERLSTGHARSSRETSDSGHRLIDRCIFIFYFNASACNRLGVNKRVVQLFMYFHK